MLHKRKVRSGAVLEIEYYNVSDKVRNVKKATPPKEKARSPEEQEEINKKQSIKRFTRFFNTNFGPWAFYVTLTFSDEHLPADFASFKIVITNYVRRLQYACPKLRLVAVMGRGKRTGRLHAHLVIMGANKRQIINKWGLGKVAKIEPLKENNIYEGKNCGRDYSGLATYMLEHWTKEQGGHRYKKAGNLWQPDTGETKPVKRNVPSIDCPPPAPEGYTLIRAYECGGAKDSHQNAEQIQNITGAYRCFTYVRSEDVPNIKYTMYNRQDYLPYI